MKSVIQFCFIQGWPKKNKIVPICFSQKCQIPLNQKNNLYHHHVRLNRAAQQISNTFQSQTIPVILSSISKPMHKIQTQAISHRIPCIDKTLITDPRLTQQLKIPIKQLIQLETIRFQFILLIDTGQVWSPLVL